MAEDKRPRGRPVGKDYGVVKSVRLTQRDDALLGALADERGCSEAAVLRQLLRKAAKSAGIREPLSKETGCAPEESPTGTAGAEGASSTK